MSKKVIATMAEAIEATSSRTEVNLLDEFEEIFDKDILYDKMDAVNKKIKQDRAYY